MKFDDVLLFSAFQKKFLSKTTIPNIKSDIGVVIGNMDSIGYITFQKNRKYYKTFVDYSNFVKFYNKLSNDLLHETYLQFLQNYTRIIPWNMISKYVPKNY